LIFPALLFGLSALLVWIFGDDLVFPEEFDDVVVWLRSHGEYAWAVGAGLILADSLLPVPSTPAMFSMGIIYGPLIGGAVCGAASVVAGFVGFGATRLLGRRGALFLVGEKDLERTQAFYRRWGLYAVVFGRAIGGPAEWAVILAGLSKMAVLDVLGALCLGGFASGLVIATLGAMAVTQPLLAVALTLILLAVTLFVGHWMTRSVPDPATRA
jgi:uncharacterized membrane protein YdjX (TVP38/TMEM64 family)